MMKRLTLTGLILAAAIACCGASAAPALAGCYEVDKGEGVKFQTGHWKNAACTEVSNKKEETEYVTGTLGKELRKELYCLKVEGSEEGFYEEAGCSKEETNGKYIKVHFTPPHLFSATEMGNLTLKSMSNAVFENASGTFSCTGVQLTSGSAVLSAKTLQATIAYTGCSYFGFVNNHFTPMQYEFTADGNMSLLSSATLTPLGAGCTLTWPSSKNKNLGTVKYKQAGKTIEIEPAISGLTSVGSGGLCGGESSGTLVWNGLLAFASGTGSLEWH